MSRVNEIENLLVDDLVKGIPGGTRPFPLGELGTKGWNVLAEDLPLPLAVIKQSALLSNSRWMAGFLDHYGAVIAPHGKTTMCPQLFERQLGDGAWAITVATVHQIQVCRHFGFERVVLANQLVGRQAIRYVLDALHQDPDFEFYCLVDSVDGVRLLAEAAGAHPLSRPVNVLVEGGTPGGRTGCRDEASALEVARAAHAAGPHLALRGVEGFEGFIRGETPAEQEARVRDFVDFLVGITAACARQDLFAPGAVILTAGGSAFYDLVAEGFQRTEIGREVRMVTRSGCYLTHDSALYRDYFAQLKARTAWAGELGEGLRPALELWTYVQSRPEPTKAILTMGKRDVSYDAGPPVPELWYRPGDHRRPEPVVAGCTVTELNDQHTHMAVPAEAPLRVGDMVSFGIAHPCATFDRWQLLYLVDDAYNVLSAVRTFF